MSDNMYDFKKAKHPEWYTNGPVKVFTPEEIAAWEQEPSSKEALAKAEASAIVGPNLTRFLDGLRRRDAEDEMKDIIDGETQREVDDKP